MDPHDYDPRRAQALLNEVGWQRGADGLFTHAGGEPATIPLVARPDPTTPREIAIIADSWKSAGIGSEQSIYTPGQARDSKIGASFPGTFVGQNPLTADNTLTIVYGGLCPSDANRWSGRNHGCYLNPQWDRIADGLKSAIDPNEQRRLWRDLVKLTLDEWWACAETRDREQHRPGTLRTGTFCRGQGTGDRAGPARFPTTCHVVRVSLSPVT
ncbi:MAG: putative bacterial extracellular solute-binding protein, family 5 [Chloroflexi bacterium]|nr:putative bacterial extracellular solute-binding protein, family 5 [Chloroflexota bacterium]